MSAPKTKLHAFIAQLTTSPGVYQMLDAQGQVLYVGKARCLKNRVKQYFSHSIKGAKTKALVQQIDSIQVTVTRSETEALLLESTLIKSLRPKYNILLRPKYGYDLSSRNNILYLGRKDLISVLSNNKASVSLRVTVT